MNQPTPVELGYFMPAEWQRHTATWLSWPKDPLTWPERVPQVEEIFLQMMGALAPYEVVNLLVDDAETEALVRQRCDFPKPRIFVFINCGLSTRGFAIMAQTFANRETSTLAYNDWIFNAWGNKYES